MSINGKFLIKFNREAKECKKTMVDVLTEIIINKPLGTVSNYAANPDNAPQWYVNIKKAEWQTPKPLGVGSKVTFKAAFMRRELVYTYEIKEYIPGKKLVMRTAEGPFPMETTYTWTAVDQTATKMTLRNTGQPSGFSRWFTPLMETMMKKANRKDLKKLKEILENHHLKQ